MAELFQCHDPPDGGLGIVDAGLDDARIGGKLAIQSRAQMPAAGVGAVGFLIGAALLHDEDRFARLYHFIHFQRRERLQATPLETQLHLPLPYCLTAKAHHRFGQPSHARQSG
ncbi:hypothetical protein D3C85_1621200 [compost metagenome]